MAARGFKLLRNRIDALAIVAFHRDQGQPHLLADGPGEEAPHRMLQPTGGGHQFAESDPALVFEDRHNRSRLAVLGGTFGLGAVVGVVSAPVGC